VRSSPQTINPSHLSAALEAEKRHGRTTETDPSVPREEYVYFQGPYILITDLANVHKPIMVREYPAGSDRPKTDDEDSLWPMFWSGKEGSCPFVRPVNRPNNIKPVVAVGGDPTQKHYARPNVVAPSTVVLGENRNVGNKVMMLEQPASGIINSSNAFSAIRSTTTCGSNITSTLSGLGGGAGGALSATNASLPRPVRDLKSRLTTIPPQREEMPPPKKRRVETLREQLAKTKTKKKPAKEGYCENCKERYDEYEEVATPF
jgi:regulatory subunit for Cdc7p protein kinase